jgi:hypothetical protein
LAFDRRGPISTAATCHAPSVTSLAKAIWVVLGIIVFLVFLASQTTMAHG